LVRAVPLARFSAWVGGGSGFGVQAAERVKYKPTQNQIMQAQIMASLGSFFVLIYLACVVAVIIYVLRLLGRFVSAHERVASSLDIIARKMRDDAKP
jgi:hypothetical protein